MQLLPTRLVNAGPMEGLARLQADLALRQKELSTGQKADIGLEVGNEIRRNVSLRSSLNEMESFQRLNGVAATRLAGAQTALTSIANSASEFLSNGIPARDAPNARFLMGQAASNALSDLTRNLNTEIGGFPVFGGENLDAKPMKDFSGVEGNPAKAAINNLFQTEFGFLPDDPLAANLSANDLSGFLTGPFANLFDANHWGTLWSSASGSAMRSEVSPGIEVETGSTTHLSGLRDLTQGYVALSFFKDTAINDAAYKGIIDAALGSTSNASSELTAAQADLGLSEERVSNATERLGEMQTVFSRSLTSLEAANPIDVAAKINSLLTGIEATYAMTARLQRLSLLNFL